MNDIKDDVHIQNIICKTINTVLILNVDFDL